MIVRVELITGDSRTGRYLGHDETSLYIHDGYKRREIKLHMIADVSEPPKIGESFEKCIGE